MTPYPQFFGIDISHHAFYLARQGRDVIKMGRFRMWDLGPGPGCPVKDRFFRSSGVRVFMPVKA